METTVTTAATATTTTLHSTRLSSKGQVVIPKDVRDRLRLREGDELSVEEVDDAIVLRVKRGATAGLFGPALAVDELLARLSGLYTGPPVAEAEARRRQREGLRKRWTDAQRRSAATPLRPPR